MSTQKSGGFGITHVYLESRIRFIAGVMSFALTVGWEAGTVWRYTLSLVSDTTRNSRAGYGRILTADDQAAMLRTAELLAEGYVQAMSSAAEAVSQATRYLSRLTALAVGLRNVRLTAIVNQIAKAVQDAEIALQPCRRLGRCRQVCPIGHVRFAP